MLPRGLSFHDAVITAVARSGDDVTLTVEGVQVARSGAPSATPENCDLVGGTVTFSAVRQVVVNDAPAGTIAMNGDDGEILRLDWRDGGEAEMFVIWARYADRQEQNSFYRIACAGLVWTPGKPA